MKINSENTVNSDNYRQACRFIPGGVNSPARSFGGIKRPPVFVESAEGSKIYDTEGNEYIDYVCSWGAVIAGHSDERVIDTVKKAAEKGTSFGAPTRNETELARRITEAFDSIDKVRLVNSGTEAVMSAVRLAKGYTGRDMIIKMDGCYHGHSDSLLVSAGSGVAENPNPSSAGVSPQVAHLTCSVPYNDIEAVESAFRRYEGRIAAVLVEPVAANMGVIPPAKGYLTKLRKICDKNGALLIFDEVITGFRLCYGGAQHIYNVKPDITCLGKIIGGGFPLAAFGGKSEIMDRLSPNGDVYQAGTLSGNPVATAAALSTLDIISEDGCYYKLESAAAALEEGIKKSAEDAGLDVTVNRVGSLLSCFFTNNEVVNFRDVSESNIDMFKKYAAAMIENGIYTAPSAFESMFISLAHTEQDIETTVSTIDKIFKNISD